MSETLAPAALDQLFRSARTHYGWTDQPVTDDDVRALYELMKWGPTSANSSPARFVWVRSPEAKERLAAVTWERNRPKMLAAPVTVIIGHDHAFADQLPKLMPHNYEAMQKAFAPAPIAEVTAMRNGTLQGAYLIIAARALGLDCGPMSGFDNAGVDAAFFAGTAIRSNFICSIGHGDPAALYPRNPRLSFEEAGRFE